MTRFAPLLCVLPVAANFANDYRNGMFPLMIQREGLNRHLWHKILSAWLTGTVPYSGDADGGGDPVWFCGSDASWGMGDHGAELCC